MSSDASTASAVTVELFESEVIAGRGKRLVTWRVRHNDGWFAAAEHPAVIAVERLEAGPSTVWERRIELALAPGTRLVREESAPAPEAKRDAFDHLTAMRRTPRRRKHTSEYRVGSRGELLTAGARAPRRPPRRPG